MARVTSGDWEEIRKLSRGYCRTVDSTRSRKRMDGSATVVREGYAPYGTDDVSDDVTQDAVLLFAQRLRDVLTRYAYAPESSPEHPAWIYVKRDGTEMTITRTTLKRWAVRDAAARNGYRVDVPPEEIDAIPGAQLMRGLPHAETVTHAAVAFSVAQHSAELFRAAYGNGHDFPTLTKVMEIAANADDLGRAGVLATTAQACYGGAYGSRRAVICTRDAGRAELRELTSRLDDTRNAMVYTGMQVASNS
jgi:galactarate dehydratase